MDKQHKKIIGIIGGMGPMATCDLFSKIIRTTQAHKDQDHVHLIIDNDTEIPDRSAHILGHGENPVPEIKHVIQTLILDGADILAMPCNTAHYYYDELRAYAEALNPNIHFVHMIEEVAKWCYHKGFRKLFLLSTYGTYQSDLYRKYFDQVGIDLLYPTDDQQAVVMQVIYAYKNKEPIDHMGLNDLLRKTEKMDVDGLILGCTELPLVIAKEESPMVLIDPGAILAKKLAELGQKMIEY